MNIHQFYDQGLAHGSYAIVSQGEMAVVDPGRDPQPYLDWAAEHGATLRAIFETHPHADFVSAHRELADRTGATIYVSGLVQADYPHEAFDEGTTVRLGACTFEAINTPGHSPDSITVLLRDADGKQRAAFTGDTLFVGDVGRPDLREAAGAVHAQRVELAKQMFHTVRHKLMPLDDEVTVYPAHGPGSLCGKALGSELTSTMGREKARNYAFQIDNEDQFVATLLADQPFIPKYFPYDVGLNKRGAAALAEGLAAVPRHGAGTPVPGGTLVIDARPASDFKRGHLPGAVNLQDGGKFETWLGSIVHPGERFFLIAADEAAREALIRKAAKIGYEPMIAGAWAGAPAAARSITAPELNVGAFADRTTDYTIVDIRNAGEVADGPLFEGSLAIPLHQLRERAGEVPTDKPVVVHCAAGYRSAAGSSILAGALPDTDVYDLGEAVKDFQPA
ncbi:MAG: rhodanese-like domain-containing protein [Catalinimonas sp.]